MTPDLLKAFITVTETGNFTLASQRIGRTQGAVSHMMKRLEDELGCLLFNRNSTPVTLTENGAKLMPYARQMLSLHSETLGAFQRSELDGVVAIGMPEIYAEHLIPKFLPSFKERFPNVRIDLELHDTVELLALLQSGELDLSFATQGEGADLNGPVVHTANVVWIAPVGMALENLDPLPLVVWKYGSNYEKTVLQALRSVSRPATVVVNTQSMSGLIASIRSNLGVAATIADTPYRNIRILGKECGLPVIPPRKVHLERAYSHRNPAVDVFQKHVLSALSAE